MSLPELTVGLVIIGLLLSAAAPSWVRWRQRQRLTAACSAIAMQIAVLRARASAHGRHFGIEFAGAGDLRWQVLEDGDGDGISGRDLDDLIDRRVGAPRHLRREFPGIEAGAAVGVPALSGTLPSDGVAFGRFDRLSIAPEGTATSGSVYLHNRTGDTAAVRVYGPTGRVAVWRFSRRQGGWERLR